MRKHCSNVCKFRQCLATESTNSAPMRTIVTAALQRQYWSTELIFWITLVHCDISGTVALQNLRKADWEDDRPRQTAAV